MPLGTYLIYSPFFFQIRGLLLGLRKNFPEKKRLIKTVWLGRKRPAQTSSAGNEGEKEL